jgi:DNA-binding phage protein
MPRNRTVELQVEPLPAVDPALLAFLAEEIKTQDAARIVKALRKTVEAMGWPAFVHRVGICRLVLERDLSRGAEMPRSTLIRVASGLGISLEWRAGPDAQVTETIHR